MTNENKPDADAAERKALYKQSTYTVEGRRFVVTPAFHEGGHETFGDILMRLMKADATEKS